MDWALACAICVGSLATCLAAWSCLLVTIARQTRKVQPNPSGGNAILLLGGDADRECLTAVLAGQGHLSDTERALLARRACVPPAAAQLLSDPSIPILVSSAHGDVALVMARHGVPRARLRIDDTATDTLTNFTTSLPALRMLAASWVMVLTSDYHAPRAACLAVLLLPPVGVRFACVGLGSGGAGSAARGLAGRAREAWKWAAEVLVKAPRDAARAVAWRCLGWDGTSVGRLVHPERFWHLG